MNNCNCAEHNLTDEAFLDLTITQSVEALVEYNFTGLKLDGCECSNCRRWSRDRCRVSDAMSLLRPDPTFCFLAGIDGSDDSPTPPKPIDPALGLDQDVRPTLPGACLPLSLTGRVATRSGARTHGRV